MKKSENEREKSEEVLCLLWMCRWYKR